MCRRHYKEALASGAVVTSLPASPGASTPPFPRSSTPPFPKT
jgi:hypothetical protein